MRYATSWPQRAEKQRCPGRGREKGSGASDSPAQLSEDWRAASRLHVVHVHKLPGQEGVWETKKMHEEENAPKFINTKCSLSNEYTWCLKMTAKIIMYFVLPWNQLFSLLIIENFMTSFLYVYSTHCKSLSHIVIPFILKIMFQGRVSIIPNLQVKKPGHEVEPAPLWTES